LLNVFICVLPVLYNVYLFVCVGSSLMVSWWETIVV